MLTGRPPKFTINGLRLARRRLLKFSSAREADAVQMFMLPSFARIRNMGLSACFMIHR